MYVIMYAHFVPTFTGCLILAELVARVAATLEPTQSVHALRCAVVGAFTTLINICKRMYVRTYIRMHTS